MLFPVDGRRVDRGEGRINENILLSQMNTLSGLTPPNEFTIICISNLFFLSSLNHLGSDWNWGGLEDGLGTICSSPTTRVCINLEHRSPQNPQKLWVCLWSGRTEMALPLLEEEIRFGEKKKIAF